MFWRIELREKKGNYDPVAAALKKDIKDLGIKQVKQVNYIHNFLIESDLTEKQVTLIAERLLVDDVTQEYSLSPFKYSAKDSYIVEVAYNRGVMDPVEESFLKAVKDLDIDNQIIVKTSRKYILQGKLNKSQIDLIKEKLLYNKLIQHIVKDEDSLRDSLKIKKPAVDNFKSRIIDIINASDQVLKQTSSQMQLFLNIVEMRTIKDYFSKLNRNPTDCELETIAQTWSEHCNHKTLRGNIHYTEKTFKDKKLVEKKVFINNLLKQTIMKVTRLLKKSWCVSVFEDNSGIIRFDEKHNICFKVETHNHPSALEPFGGANTGIGGVIRDCLGTGLGAKPILNTDVFCFAQPDYPFTKIPAGILHPKRVIKGVVSGVRDYGNKMGIPTVNGAVLFHERFLGNPLVYCGTIGILPKDKSFKKVNNRDLIVVVGGKTGRDGIHGATFSSGDLTHESEEVSSGAVQIGNPIEEKKVTDVIIKARDKNLYTSITDCGAGGLSSAVGEMGITLGARVDLEKVPLKYEGLSYDEIWISESQERMVLSVAPRKVKSLIKLFAEENVEATVIGEFIDSKKLELFFHGNRVCELDMHFLHEGVPRLEKQAEFSELNPQGISFKQPKDLTEVLKKLLCSYDICSKEWVIRQYDHEVQAGSVIKPLTGVKNDGPSDASVVRPLLDSKKAVAVANGINFRYGMIDPFWMAASAIDEALRQIVCVGGSIERLAILDNFCWGNPDKPDRLGGLVRCALGCFYAAKEFKVPFISGKDSLYNEFVSGKNTIEIPGTILISAMAVMEDANKAITMDFKDKNNLIYIVGTTFDELGGSQYLDIVKKSSTFVPKVDARLARKSMLNLQTAINKGWVRSCHDCSEGGLAVSLSEMCLASGFGANIDLAKVPFSPINQPQLKTREDVILFSQSNSRFIIEVEPDNKDSLEKALKGVVFSCIGSVTDSAYLEINGLKKKTVIKEKISQLKESWQKTLRW
ncbi:MAG: phosphoribosylformylglycinamidine synthase subunit PurL [Candidatus Gygaella obscura]|nr:phosphoribosylformylglycinamidine synthase subunit PurL [Candidatus Gygaella obscura]